LYTGDIDGVLAIWKLSEILQAIPVTNRPKVTFFLPFSAL